ncbi:MAG: 5-formyltetrahydrofolate cyclo-ligase [Oscillospiraceae bacterium]|nr:5-formyltetrahydrofolate cyclo-ligase [Oscillospiraceae bacterium]
MTAKKELRKKLLEELEKPGEDRYVDCDLEIFRNVTGLPEYKKARTVFVYYSVGREADTKRIIEKSLGDRKRVALPMSACVSAPCFAEYTPGRLVVSGRLNIPSPAGDAAPVEPREDDIMIIPGLAFDAAGYRLGRGGGFYDRYLAKRSCFKTGICPDRFFLPELPVEGFDVLMDCVVTEKRIVRFS